MFKALFVAALLSIAALPAQAAVRAAGQVSATAEMAKAPTTPDAESTAIVRKLDALLTTRFEAAARIASVQARRQALEELDSFAEMTVGGLIDAAAETEAGSSILEDLHGILSAHQNEIAAALAALPRAAR